MGRSPRRRDEKGAALVLVLVFVAVGSLIVGALAVALTNDLHNSTNFASARDLQYEASSATSLAIDDIRYHPNLTATLNASPPASCGSTFDEIAVWCSTVWQPTSADTRVVTLSACPTSTTAADCARQPLLQTVVTFDDYPPGVSAPSSVQCWVYCGTSVTVDSWVPLAEPPSLTGTLSPAGGSTNGGTPITIDGTGFVDGSTVQFVEESDGVPASDNVVLEATSVKVDGPKELTAVSPPIIEGETYFVTVTTPDGTTPYSEKYVFTYTPAAPSICSLSTVAVSGVPDPGGPTAGGTLVTIDGSGFVAGATVSFVDSADPSVAYPGGYVSVGTAPSGAPCGLEQITAVAPPVTQGSTYDVTVQTPGGTTSYSDYTYVLEIPTIADPSFTGAPKSPITITGSGFYENAKVILVPETNGTAGIPTTSLTPSAQTLTPTSMTVTLPSTLKSGTYFVEVSLPGGSTSSNDPVLTVT